MDAFEAFASERIKIALLDIDASEIPDIYAISFFVYDHDNDPRVPTLTIGFNTNSRWIACSPAVGKPDGWPVASDSDEAKWNFAFWLQNDLLVLGTPETEGSALCRQWLDSLSLSYTDEDDVMDSAKCDEIADQTTQVFVDLCVRVAHQLRADGFIFSRLGRVVPILVHELEYYEQIAEQTARANPPGLTKDFEMWINGPV